MEEKTLAEKGKETGAYFYAGRIVYFENDVREAIKRLKVKCYEMVESQYDDDSTWTNCCGEEAYCPNCSKWIRKIKEVFGEELTK